MDKLKGISRRVIKYRGQTNSYIKTRYKLYLATKNQSMVKVIRKIRQSKVSLELETKEQWRYISNHFKQFQQHKMARLFCQGHRTLIFFLTPKSFEKEDYK